MKAAGFLSRWATLEEKVFCLTAGMDGLRNTFTCLLVGGAMGGRQMDGKGHKRGKVICFEALYTLECLGGLECRAHAMKHSNGGVLLLG